MPTPTKEKPIGRDADEYQVGRGAALYRNEPAATMALAYHSPAWWRNEGILDARAGIPSRTGAETIYTDANGSTLPVILRAIGTGAVQAVTRTAPARPSNGVVQVAQAGPVVRVAPAAPAPKPGQLGAYVPAPGQGDVISFAPAIGPDSAAMAAAIGPHGEIGDLLPLLLLLGIGGGQSRAGGQVDYYGGYQPPPPVYYGQGRYRY